MTIEEIEDLAYQRIPMPETNRSLADILAYQSFRNLYEFAGRVGMSPEQGKREKAQILDAHRLHIFHEKLWLQTSDMWKDLEPAACEYRKNPSIAAADKVLKILYGVERILP